MARSGLELFLLSAPPREDRPQSIRLPPEGMTLRVGRPSEAQLPDGYVAAVLNDRSLSINKHLLSRVHADLWLERGLVRIADGGRGGSKGSANGTGLDGQALPPGGSALVRQGCRVEFGAPHLRRSHCTPPGEFVYELRCVPGDDDDMAKKVEITQPEPSQVREVSDIRVLEPSTQELLPSQALSPLCDLAPLSCSRHVTNGTVGSSSAAQTQLRGDIPFPQRPSDLACERHDLPAHVERLLQYAMSLNNEPQNESPCDLDEVGMHADVARIGLLSMISAVSGVSCLSEDAEHLLWRNATRAEVDVEGRFLGMDGKPVASIVALRACGAEWLAQAAINFWRERL